MNKEFTHEIFILAGISELEYKSVLAHELGHVWLNEHDIYLPKKKLRVFAIHFLSIFYPVKKVWKLIFKKHFLWIVMIRYTEMVSGKCLL